MIHDDVIKWKHFPRYWPFVRGVHRSPVNSPHKGQWRGALMFSLICAWINVWVNNGEAGDLRRRRAHYVVTVIFLIDIVYCNHATTSYNILEDSDSLLCKWTISRITGPFWANPHFSQKELVIWSFLCCQPTQGLELTIELPMIWDVMVLMLLHYAEDGKLHDCNSLWIVAKGLSKIIG